MRGLFSKDFCRLFHYNSEVSWLMIVASLYVNTDKLTYVWLDDKFQTFLVTPNSVDNLSHSQTNQVLCKWLNISIAVFAIKKKAPYA